MDNTIQFSSTVDKITTLKDGGNKITIETQELPPEHMTKLFEFANKQVWTLFKETPDIKADEIDIEEPEPEFKKDKSPALRLRNVLYVLYEQKYSSNGSFDDFYKKQMENIIKQFKNKLDD